MSHTQVPSEILAKLEETLLNAVYNATGSVFCLWYALKLKK